MEQNKNWKEDLKNKTAEIKNAAVEKACAAWDWAKANPQYSVPLALVGAKATADFIKDVRRAHNIKVKDIANSKRVWDPSLGYYHKLRRPLTTDEIRYYNKMLAAGMTRLDILDQMRVLK